MIVNALHDKPLPVYGDGGNVRDWLHVEDHCEALLGVLEGGRAGEVYNIGGGAERKNIELVRGLLRLLGKSERTHPFRRGPAGPRPPVRDRSRARFATNSAGSPRTRSSRVWPRRCAGTSTTPSWWEHVNSGAYRQYFETPVPRSTRARPRLSSMRVLVTGANGLVGSRLRGSVCQRGHEVTGFGRGPRRFGSGPVAYVTVEPRG